MDKSLQERLVGAAVLIALGVWLIPWVLDGSAVDTPEQAERVALKLPVPDRDGEAPMRHETIDLGAADRGAALKGPQSGTVMRQPAPQSVAEGTSPAEIAAPETEEVAAEPVAAASIADSSTAAQAPPTGNPSGATNNATANRPAAEKESTPDPPAAAPSPADILAASPVAGWMVQLGSFSDAGNARRQASRINTYGHTAQIYEFSAAGGRTMFRVRLGPVESRERAEATASALAAHGFVAQLVAPE